MSFATEWERFYTENVDDPDNYDIVDYLCLNPKTKEYSLEIGANSLVTDGEDEDGNEIYSTYVSRFIFDLLVKGVKDAKFIKSVYKAEDDF